MNMNNAVKSLLLSTAVAFASSALAVSEKELNNATTEAQVLTAAGTAIEVTAFMGFPDKPMMTDVDFFKFTAKKGDLLTIDIDNGFKGPAPLNTIVAIFRDEPGYPLLRMNDDAPVDDGSISEKDARIDDFVVPNDGAYIIGVSSSGRFFMSGGMTTEGMPVPGGAELSGDMTTAGMPVPGSAEVITDYKLSINGASSIGPQKINIEVKPGSDELAPLNPRSRGKIPVAILGSINFSAINVDKSSLTFGSSGSEQSLHKCAKSGEDVNSDGFYDLVCHFDNQKSGFKYGDIEGILKGKTKSGKAFEGRALLKVFPTR